MPMMLALLKIEDLHKLDDRQSELLRGVVSNEIRTNPEIVKILKARASVALKTLKASKKAG